MTHRLKARCVGVLSAWIFVIACGSESLHRSPEPIPPIGNVEVFGAGEWRVEVAYFSGGEEALIRILGSGTELDGVPLRYQLEADGDRARWVTQYRGQRRSFFYSWRKPNGDVAHRVKLPGVQEPREVDPVPTVPPALADDLMNRYRQALDGGTVAELRDFDRERAIREQDADLVRHSRLVQRDCGDWFQGVSIDWSTVSDEDVMAGRALVRCRPAVGGLRSLCSRDGATAWLRERFDSMVCTLGSEAAAPRPAVADRVLTVALPRDLDNVQNRTVTALMALPDDADGTLEGHLAFQGSDVCTNQNQDRFLIVPADRETGVAYGTRERIVQLPPVAGLRRGWFFEPRYQNPHHPANHGGINLQFYNRVEVEEGRCNLICGEREIELVSVDEATKGEVYRLGRSRASFDRVPHALARDRRGNYYYVDRIDSNGPARDFRLYRGRRGAMTQLAMRDIVHDSQGDVFESDRGTLRLVLDRDEAAWVQNQRTTNLVQLPIQENLGVIFQELGVYLGVSMGTPCEDL